MTPAIPKKAAFFCFFLLILSSRGFSQPNFSPSVTPTNITTPTNHERDLGSVGGRVFDLTSEQSAVNDGIPDVLVILRSADPGFENFSREKLTNEKGVYSFQDLPEGNYTVTISTKELPWQFRASEPSGVSFAIKPLNRTFVDLTVEPQRAVTGIVFIDKDGDGKFDQNADQPVSGARVSFNGSYAISGPNGTYYLSELPSGRIAFLAAAPHLGTSTHIVLELPERSSKPRIVNIPLSL
ncbi:MAG: carboxypeptidase-like regulatory domain-containing protein [Pyrinomonadaceae bacterium]